MRVRVLGELEVELDGARVDLGGPKPRELLGLLVAAGGRPVPVASLIDQIWGEAPPARVEASLQSYVARLRRALEPDRGARAAAQRLRTHAGGYSLAVDDHAVDARRFAALVRSARDEAPSPARADLLLREALDLWHGPAYAGAAAPTLQAEATRLEELRLQAVESLLRLRVDAGDHQAAAAELEQLVAEHPLREGLWELLALALYRSARQGDALAALRRARDVLADELGVDPGPALREMEAAVLRQAPELDAGPAPAPLAAPHPVPQPTASVPGAGLFGRDAELAAATDVLDVAAAGRGGTLLVTGEPGIGKTRFTDAVLELAGARGFRTGRGGWEPEATPPLWGWSRAVRQALGADDVLDTGGGDAASASFRQAEALLGAVRGGPATLLVLDDVHWADAGSLRLLRRVAAEVGEAPLVVLAATRTGPADDTPALTDLLAAMARGGTRRLDLRGLDPAALTAWVSDDAGVAVDREVGRRLALRTDGNPFYVHELVQLLVSEGALTRPGDEAWGAVPATVRDVVRQRLEGLDARARRTTEQAAVAGRAFDVTTLAAATGLALDEVEEDVETLQVLGLVEDTGPGRYRFTHALVRDAIYERLTATTRARLHASAAVALEADAHGEVASHAPELATHYRLAGPAYARSAWLFAVTAARAAADRAAYDDALALLDDAAQLQARDAAATAPEREDVHVHRARALVGLSRPVDAWHAVAAAASSALERGDPPAAAAALLVITERMGWGWRTHPFWDADAVALWRRALDAYEAVPGHDPVVVARLVGALSFELFFKPGAEEQSLALAEEAVARVRRSSDDPADRLAVLGLALKALLRPWLLARRAPYYDEMVELAGRVDDVALLTTTLTGRASDRAEQGRLEEVRRDVARAADLAAEHGLMENVLIAGWARGLLLQLDGDPDGAEALLRELADLEATLAMAARGAGLGQLAFLREEQGRLGELEPVLARVAAHHPVLRDLHALALVRAGRPEDARRALGSWREQPPVSPDYLFVVRTVLRSWLWTALEDPDAVAALREVLAPYAERMALGSMNLLAGGSLHVTLAELAVAAGDRRAAEEHLAQARARHDETGVRVWDARVERLQRRLDACV